jgi:hypothetical protein
MISTLLVGVFTLSAAAFGLLRELGLITACLFNLNLALACGWISHGVQPLSEDNKEDDFEWALDPRSGCEVLVWSSISGSAAEVSESCSPFGKPLFSSCRALCDGDLPKVSRPAVNGGDGYDLPR